MKDLNGNDLNVGDRVVIAGVVQRETDAQGLLTVELDASTAAGHRATVAVEASQVTLRDKPAVEVPESAPAPAPAAHEPAPAEKETAKEHHKAPAASHAKDHGHRKH